MFFPPIDVQQALVQHTQSMSVPIRHPSDKSYVLVVTSFETYVYIPVRHKYNEVPGTYAVYACVWRLWVVFLEHGGWALGIFKSRVCTYNQARTFFFPLQTIFPSWASVAGGVCRPRREAPCIYYCCWGANKKKCWLFVSAKNPARGVRFWLRFNMHLFLAQSDQVYTCFWQLRDVTVRVGR